MTDHFTRLQANNIFFSYDNETEDCIKEISIQLKSGRFYGLIGPNGSGKSTFLDLLSGHLVPNQGYIRLNGKDLTEFSRKETASQMSAVPQAFSLNFNYSVEEVVFMGRYVHIPRFSPPKQADYESVDRAIATMGITHLKHRSVTKLSGGEKQRVMIARSLAQNTDIILLDEVTSNLDINHSIAIMKTMSQLVCSEGRTVVAALHDLNMASIFCNDLIVLKEGTIIATGRSSEVITEQLIQDLYNVSSTISSAGHSEKKHIRFSYQ